MIVVLLSLCASARAETALTVDQAVALAVAHNPDVRSAQLQQLVAEISATRAELDRFSATVGVDGNLGLGATKPWGEPGYTTTDGRWGATASAGVPLYAGGRVKAAIDQAHADAAISGLDARVTEREIVRAAYSAYWNVRGLELQIAAAREGIDASKEALAIIQSKADNGLAAGIDVNRSTVDLLSQQEGVLQEESVLARAREQLVRLLAADDPDLVLLTDPPAAEPDPEVVLRDQPLQTRPELARQQLSLDRADAAKRLAQSAALPTVSLTGAASLAADQSCLRTQGQPACTSSSGATALQPFAVGELAHPTLAGTVGLSLAWNPFDLLRTHQAVEQANLLIQQTAAANESELDQLQADLRSARADLRSLRQRYPVVDQQVALARDNQTIVQDLYAQGSATILDLFNAQAAFRQAAIQQAALQVDLATAELDLRWLQGDDLTSASGDAR